MKAGEKGIRARGYSACQLRKERTSSGLDSELELRPLRGAVPGKKKDEETPIGVVILGVLPFVIMFWMLLWRAL